MKLDRIIAVRNSKTVYCEGDSSFKVFNDQYKKSDVLSEALNQARLEETGLNIPKILEVTVINGKWAIVYEHIKGKNLAALMTEHPEKKDEYIDKFINLQLDVLSKKCPELTLLSDKLTRSICDTDFAATVRYDLLDRLNDMPKHTKICHGDFNPSNIVISDKNAPFILDWSHAAKGNGAADAAGTAAASRARSRISRALPSPPPSKAPRRQPPVRSRASPAAATTAAESSKIPRAAARRDRAEEPRHHLGRHWAGRKRIQSPWRDPYARKRYGSPQGFLSVWLNGAHPGHAT